MLAGALLSVVLAQAVPPAGPDAADVARIRKALTAPPAIALTPVEQREGPVFKVTIEASIPGKPWDDWTNVPSYIRPYWRGYQYEYLAMVAQDPVIAAEEFRAGILYPVGIPVVPLVGALRKQIQEAHRKSQEEHAREEVQAEFARLLACRADPAKPGC